MITKTIIGIDPGVEGALVVLTPSGLISAVHNVPVVETSKPRAKKKVDPTKKQRKMSDVKITKRVDFIGMSSLLKPYLYDCLVQDMAMVCVEDITHLFGMPSETNFKLGHSVGVIHSAIQRYSDEFFTVPVKKWQSGIWEPQDMVYKPNKRVDTKATTKKAFKRLFPDYKGINSDGVRDAALIAWYARTGGI